MQQFNQILQIATATVLALTALALMVSLRQGKHLWAGVGFSICGFCYLIIETQFGQTSFFHFFIMTGSICVPVFFWLLSKSIFEDHFTFRPSIAGWFLLQTAPHVHHYLNRVVNFPAVVTNSLNIVAQLISLGFVFGAIYVALKTQPTDLVETRLRFRTKFIVTNALLIGITLVVEAAPETLVEENKDFLQAMQRMTILGLTGYFLLSNFVFKAGFFFQEFPKSNPTILQDAALEMQLKILLTDKKIYRTEGLTIKELAGTMQVQEHRLRKLINGQLGFKNFNDFLNQYRIQEACEILADPAQNRKTILEIAYALGYQSIGPFNKAFKEQKGATPTVFRKMSQHI